MRQPAHLVIAGLLAGLALANALPGLFPRGNITTYNYYADLKTGAIEPAPFASQFVLSGLMHIKPDPNLENAYHITLNVTHNLRNGEIKHPEKIPESTLPLPDAVTELNDPFVVIFEDTGKVKALMVNEEEPEWSRNMKRSIASMLQLDLSNIKLETPVQSHSFLTEENSIYGECSVAYDVHRTPKLGEEDFTVTKFMVPMNCQNFTQYVFNLQGSEGCSIGSQQEISSASRRVFSIKYSGEDLFIKTLVAYGVINYFPWNFNTEAHYILANQSMEFAYKLPGDTENVFPALDLTKMVELDVTYQKYPTPYIDHAGPNLFEHFQSTDEISFDELTAMLNEVEDYMSTNHLEMIAPDTENGQMINRIMNMMSYMNLSSLESFLDHSKDDLRSRTVFLRILPHVGTTATSLFARDIITGGRITSTEAVPILSTLPFYIRTPTKDLLIKMEGLMNLNGTDENVYKAGILSFATMIYKTHKHESIRGKMNQVLIDKYVKYFSDHVVSEPTYEKKIVYLHAMKNMEVGGVNKVLESIIRGEMRLSEKPDYLRLHAMMAGLKLAVDSKYIYDLYWPILANTKLSLELRICAYTVLIQQPPSIEQMMNLHWFMVDEKDEQLYNFHYTTLKTLAYTSNSCLKPMTELARKVFRFTQVRPVIGTKTGAWLFDYENKEFGFGESLNLMTIADELSGTPYVGQIEYKTMKARRTVNSHAYWLRLEGFDRSFKKAFENIPANEKGSPIEKMRAILENSATYMAPEFPFHIEFVVMMQGRTVSVYSSGDWSAVEPLDTLSNITSWVTMDYKIRNEILFSDLFTMQVPNDFGLPSLLRNNIPHVASVVFNPNTFDIESLFFARIQLVLRHWNHGYHSMEMYNPILKTWHSIRRTSALDISVPVDINYSYNVITNDLKLSWRRLPATNYSDAGLRSHVQNHVMVIGANESVLKQYCSSCHSTELVTQGAKYRKTTERINFDSQETASHVSFHRYDCEKTSSPNPRFETYGDIFDRKFETSWRHDDIFAWPGLVEYSALIFVGQELGSCGYLLKLEPSTVYPASSIDIKLWWGSENSHDSSLRVLLANKRYLRATLRVNSIPKGAPLLTWIMKGNLDTNQDHLKTELSIQITRVKPEENNLQICIDGQKSYPKLHSDILRPIESAQARSTGKLIITMGETEGSECVLNDTKITINTKSEISSEQNEAIEELLINGECNTDLKNPLYLYKENNIVPRTSACLREAVFRSNLRKSTYDIAYENIPEYMVYKLQWINDIIRADLLPYATYSPAHTEAGEIKVTVEHPLDDKLLNLVVRTPTHEINYTGVSTSDEYGWKMTLDNARFSLDFVNKYRETEIKFCTIYPEFLLNGDGNHESFILANKWTLLTGDYTQYKFAIFVRHFENKKFGLFMNYDNHTIQVIPSETIPSININGQVLADYQTDPTLLSVLPELQIVWKQESSILELEYATFFVELATNFASVGVSTELQGQLKGLCGHLDGTHANRGTRAHIYED